jgi:hypothetical protein
MMSWRRDEQTRDARSEGLRQEPGCAWVASSAAICRDLQRADPQDHAKVDAPNTYHMFQLRAHYDPVLWALRTWLDSWSGLGHVAVGMHRQGYDLQLTQYDERGWRANFYPTGLNDSVVASAYGPSVPL